MSKIQILKSLFSEYGIAWAFNRGLYSFKLKLLRALPKTEKLYEKHIPMPERVDIFQINTDKIKILLTNLSDSEKIHLINQAENAVNGKILGFSSFMLDYGLPIDWQLNPLTGKRCDESKKWFTIPDFDKERGDIKVVWEASRFSHFITFARAFLLSQDKKYYEAFSSQLSDWVIKNPYGYGANYKCGQECSIRMINAMLAYSVFEREGLITDKDTENLKLLIFVCYRKVLSNFFYAYKCIKNNHTISELMGMVVGAWCCQDNKTVSKGIRLLDKVIDEQFSEDGGYCQHSFNYQRLALQDIECVLSIEKKLNRCISQKSKNKIRNAVYLMYQCQNSEGKLPNYGSNDGALIFPVTSCEYSDYRPVLNSVYALITGKKLYDTAEYSEELLWFSNGVKTELPLDDSIFRHSIQSPHAGIFTIRDCNSWMMVILNNYKHRPAHFDQLHIDLWINNKNVLCDAGTYSYTSELGKELIRNCNHNTTVLEAVDQMNQSGPFFVYNWTKSILHEAKEDSFDGTMISANGYTHKRSIKKEENIYFISDFITGKKAEKFHLILHTPCEVRIEDNTAILYLDNKEICKIECEYPIILSEAKRSLYYLRQEAINRISIEGKVGEEIKTKIKI